MKEPDILSEKVFCHKLPTKYNKGNVNILCLILEIKFWFESLGLSVTYEKDTNTQWREDGDFPYHRLVAENSDLYVSCSLSFEEDNKMYRTLEVIKLKSDTYGNINILRKLNRT